MAKLSNRKQTILDGPFAETKELVAACWPNGCALPRPRAAGRYAKVNGLLMYYEVHGRGRPLVLLHAALTTIESSFGEVLQALGRTHRVIAIEQQAHGRTPDIARPLSYQQMADDTAELLRQLEIRQADFFGYSMGGSVALQIAVRHPGLARKLAIVASGYSKEAYQPGLVSFMRSIDPAGADWSRHPLGPARRVELEQRFRRAAAEVGTWPAALARTKQAFDAHADLRSDELRSIRAHTLVVSGDDGVIRPEHMNEMSRLLPHAQLAMFPEADHRAMVARSAPLLPGFLEAPVASEAV